MARGMQTPHEIINQLSPGDGLAILQTLAREDEQLAARTRRTASRPPDLAPNFAFVLPLTPPLWPGIERNRRP